MMLNFEKNLRMSEEKKEKYYLNINPKNSKFYI